MINKSKAIAGPFKEVAEGPTAHGGAFAVTYYFDSRYKPVVKDRATRAIVHEYDEKSRSIYRDYLTLDKGKPIVRKSAQRGQKQAAAAEIPKEAAIVEIAECKVVESVNEAAIVEIAESKGIESDIKPDSEFPEEISQFLDEDLEG